VLLVGAMVGAGLYSWNSALQQAASSAGPAAAIRTAVATEKTFVQPVRLSGTISARDSVDMRAPRLRVRSQLTLTELAEAGSFVKAGDIVARFESRELQDRVDDMKSSQVQARANLDREKARVLIDREALRQQREAAKAEYDKATFDLRKAEVLSEIQAQILRNTAAEAKATWQQLEKEAALQEEVFQRRIRAEEIDIADADLRYERFARDLEQMTLRAPVGGLVVLEPMYKGGGQFQQAAVGDQVYPGTTFLKVVDLSGLVVSASVNQVDAQKVRIGQPATIHLDAYPEAEIEGRVASVGAIAGTASEGFGSRGGSGLQVKSIPVEIAFQTADPRVIPDLSAAVDVRVEEQPNALVAPRAAIVQRGDETYVRVRAGKSWVERAVETGPSNAVETVILAGLAPGEVIALESPNRP
jgi:multidrug resistance efflux pump